jgi:hypothetical protein
MLPVCLCDCVFVYPSQNDLNAWSNLCETWYVNHGTWAHLKVLLYKPPHQAVYLCVYNPLFARQRLGNCSTRPLWCIETLQMIVAITETPVTLKGRYDWKYSFSTAGPMHPNPSCVYKYVCVFMWLVLAVRQ